MSAQLPWPRQPDSRTAGQPDNRTTGHGSRADISPVMWGAEELRQKMREMEEPEKKKAREPEEPGGWAGGCNLSP